MKPQLTQDPSLPSRDTWRWCADCQALREGWHQHGDEAEELSRDELLALVRVLRLSEVRQKNGRRR